MGAAKLGVDAVLLASPYYNKPTPEGIYRHFKAVSEATDVPIMLYNVPSRTASEIDVETCVRLVRECKNVVSIKEAEGNCDLVSALRNALPPESSILSSDNSLTFPSITFLPFELDTIPPNIIPRQP